MAVYAMGDVGTCSGTAMDRVQGDRVAQTHLRFCAGGAGDGGACVREEKEVFGGDAVAMGGEEEGKFRLGIGGRVGSAEEVVGLEKFDLGVHSYQWVN